MKSATKASFFVALCFSIASTAAGAQSILNQSKDDLLKDFDAGKSLTAPPINGPANTPPPTWAPGPQTLGSQSAGAQPSGAPMQTSPFQGNYGQGATAGAYQFPGQQKPLLKRLIEGAMNAVNVSSNDTDGTHVKVPFVDVNVGGQAQGVKVKAPFVNINRGYQGGSRSTTTAPVSKINPPSGINPAHNALPAQQANPAPTVAPNVLPNQGSSLR
ncbi:MAG: hypothetical protein C0507_00980 [Cyanobacteria bacterium PR.3.49]|nr:hypothetical protein [Cyanobacteria bacterium PR.3.49]